MNLPRVVFSAHDPGGANAIVPVVRQLGERGCPLLGILSGPARDIFSRYGIQFEDGDLLLETDLFQKLNRFKPDLLLAGTSAGYTVDKKVLLHLKTMDVPAVYVLDFWNNYWQRFSSSEKDFKFLPDIVCAIDDISKTDLVKEGIPESHIRVTGNPHFEHFTEGITCQNENRNRLLFISQPVSIAVPPLSYGYDEYSVIESIIKALREFSHPYELAVRLHPKEDRGKFKKYMSEKIIISDEATLEEALSRAGFVIGMFSPVLIQAVAVGKRVVSYQPGRMGEDPLITNRLGITKRIENPRDLKRELKNYFAHPSTSISINRDPLHASGATKNVVDQVMDVC